MGTLLEDLLVAIAKKYADDPSSPSVTMSRIMRDGSPLFYASVLRYEESYGEGKKVVASATARKPGDALRLLAHKWVLNTPGGATHDLSRSLSISDGIV